MKKGIDVSYAQGSVDFNKVKNSGIEFVILRAGYSQTIDTRFLENVEKCKKVNLPVTGVYHFSYALSEKGAKEEAKFCMDCVKKAGLGTDTIIFFDYEYDSLDYAKRNNVTITKTEVNAFTKAFCETVEAAGYRAGIYFNNDFYNRFYDSNLLYKYVTWLADWDDPLNHPCDFHQYTYRGSVPGITGDVDMDYDRREEFKMESEPTKKTLDEIANEVIDGKWGNGDARVKRLTEAGYDVAAVQAKVNDIIYGKTPAKKTLDEIAKEVIDGKWGNGDIRKKLLTEAGYSYTDVQKKVNELLKKK